MNSVIAKVTFNTGKDLFVAVGAVTDLTIPTMKNGEEVALITQATKAVSIANQLPDDARVSKIEFTVGDLTKKSAYQIVETQDVVRTITIQENEMNTQATELKVEEVAATVDLSTMAKLKSSLSDISPVTAALVGGVIGGALGVTKQVMTEEGFDFAGGLKVASVTMAGASGALIGHASTGGMGASVLGAVGFAGVIMGIDIGVTYAIRESFQVVETLVANGDIEAIEGDEVVSF